LKVWSTNSKPLILSGGESNQIVEVEPVTGQSILPAAERQRDVNIPAGSPRRA